MQSFQSRTLLLQFPRNVSVRLTVCVLWMNVGQCTYKLPLQTDEMNEKSNQTIDWWVGQWIYLSSKWVTWWLDDRLTEIDRSLSNKICLHYCSKWGANHGPTNARLNRPSGSGKTGAWSAKRNDANQWIQVTFSEVTKVTGVGIQGRYDYNQWVTKFKVSYSRDGIHFVILSKVS